MKQPPPCQSIDFMKISQLSQKLRKLLTKKSRTAQIVELEKKQGQIWNQRPLKRSGPL